MLLKVIWTGCRTLAPMWVGAKATARVPRRVLWIAVNLAQPATRAPLSAHAVITRHPRVSTDSTVGRCQRDGYLAAAGRRDRIDANVRNRSLSINQPKIVRRKLSRRLLSGRAPAFQGHTPTPTSPSHLLRSPAVISPISLLIDRGASSPPFSKRKNNHRSAR